MTVTRARGILLRAASEDDFAKWIKAIAFHYGWNGIHIRWSHGVLESVHTRRRDGFSEAFGLPDWYFWHEQLGHFWAELKSWEGRADADQRRQMASMSAAGEIVYLWRPQQEVEIEKVFRDGPGALAA